MKITVPTADKSIDKLNERLDELCQIEIRKMAYGIIYWKGKPIIPIKEWRKISILDSLQFFPDGLVEIALLPEGHSVDKYDESIFPYDDGDGIPLKGTEEWKYSLDSPESKLSDAKLSYGRQELRKLRLKQK